ncbi:MAG: hypothetical protein KF764_13295 [Labilithrix sp.]|nr:hypothetical protein [Labilithrix sp.]MBX3219290.1 hypothetical protein [Labilithrix sp.]
MTLDGRNDKGAIVVHVLLSSRGRARARGPGRALFSIAPLAPALLAVGLGLGCAGPITSVHRAGEVKASSRWALLPVQNHSETPQAGERVEAILETLLRKGGVGQLDHYPSPKEGDAQLFTSDRQRYEAALEWARGSKYDYAVTGSVEEWRYKSGLDGEPAIGVSMRVLELASGKVVWAATGTQTGTSAENASGTALRLLDRLVHELHDTR